jgi:uncharacterized protein DUF4337
MSHDPTEHIQEEIQHHAAHEHDHAQAAGAKSSRWIATAASTAAMLAALAAVSGALATSHLTESTHKRIESNDKWSYYQSKSLKNYLIETKREILIALDRTPSPRDAAKIEENDLEKRKTKTEAEALERLSKVHLQAHETFELAATMFHVSIAIVAISLVAKRKLFWYLSMGIGVIGLVFFATAFRSASRAHAEEHSSPAIAAVIEAAQHAASENQSDPKPPKPPKPD